MASVALPEQEATGATGTAGVAPDAFRVLDWPCCAAPSILSAWDALAARATEPNPFLEAWYLLPSLRACDPGESVRVFLYEPGGVLCGLMPVVSSPRYYGRPLPHLAGWTHPNGFLGVPLVARGHERGFWQALLGWADEAHGAGLFLHLPEVPLGGPLVRALDAVLAQQRRKAGIVHRAERALLAAGQSPEAYFAASLSGKKRKELRRQQARLAELGQVAFERRTDAAGLEEWMDAFLALEAAGWKGRAGSALASAEATAKLFREALSGAAAHGRLERLALLLDGRPIAMLATFVAPPAAFSFKTAFDEDYARFSPGVLLQCENLLVLDRADIAWSDSCAAEGHPMIDHIWRERRAIGRLSIAIGGRVRRSLFARLLRLELSRRRKGAAA